MSAMNTAASSNALMNMILINLGCIVAFNIRWINCGNTLLMRHALVKANTAIKKATIWELGLKETTMLRFLQLSYRRIPLR